MTAYGVKWMVVWHVCVYTFVMSSNKTLKHCLKLTSMYNKTYKTDFAIE